MRGELTMAACAGLASGTLMTSIRKRAEFGSWSGASREQPGQLVGRADARRAGHVDVDVRLVVRVLDHRVGVRAAAGLHVADVLRRRDVGDVEDPDAAEALGAHRVLDALRAAVEAARGALARHEEQVLVHRDVALRRRAEVADRERRLGGVGNVPDLEAVVVALDGVLAGERQVGVRGAQELLGRRRLGDDLHVPGRLGGVHLAGLEADPRVGGGLGRGRGGGRGARRRRTPRQGQRPEGEGEREERGRTANGVCGCHGGFL